MKPSLRIYFENKTEIELIKETAQLLNSPVSNLIREILLEALPRLNELGHALKKAKGDPVAAERFLNMVARNAQSDLIDELDKLSESVNETTNRNQKTK